MGGPDPNLDLNDEQLLRYSRHILLPEIGIEGQQKLHAAHALVIGAGGLGSPISLYLAASGVGRITLCDHDIVDLTNLQRQIVHTTDSVGSAKVSSAQATLARATLAPATVQAILITPSTPQPSRSSTPRASPARAGTGECRTAPSPNRSGNGPTKPPEIWS